MNILLQVENAGSVIGYWIVAIAILCNVGCALIGCYLVLRRMSLLGDAISHAVLPGLVAAFLISGSRASLPMFAGAMLVGILTAFLSQTVHRFANVSEDASMGVVFTALFAVGVLLLQGIKVDLDPSCVLMGQIEFEAIDTRPFFGAEVPFAVFSLGGALLVILLFIGLFWKELKISSFDPALGTSLGFSAGGLFYLLMAMVAGTTVVAFWAVGSILVVAMLIIPGATAHLLVDRLSSMMAVSAGVAVISAVGGYLLADLWNTSTAGMMAVVAGAQYFLMVFLSPRRGLFFRWVQGGIMTLRIYREDLLAAIYRWGEGHSGAPCPVPEARRITGGGWRFAIGLWLLKLRRQVGASGSLLQLTEAGEKLGAELVRSHRLWETFLSREVGLPTDHLHEPAMQMEHYVTPEMERGIEADLKDLSIDPHGKPIPRRGGEEAG